MPYPKNDLKSKNILFIVHNYTNFQKNPIEIASEFFNKIYVMVRYKPISRIAKYLPIKWLKKYSDENVIDKRNLPVNVELILTPVWYLPYGLFNRLLGFLHYIAVDRIIKKRKIQFDIVHSHFAWSAGFVGMRLKNKYKVPLVITGHRYDIIDLPLKNLWWKNQIIKILNNANSVITVSQANKNFILSLGLEESQISVIVNGFDEKTFKKINKNIAREKLGIASDNKIFLSVGMLIHRKGFNYLIESMRELVKIYPQAHLYIIGEGEMHNDLSNMISSFSLQENITLLGFLFHEEINLWMNACDLFVLASLHEGLPTVVLEALACGKPVVSTAIGGVPEIVRNYEDGLLVEPSNSTELFNALLIGLNTQWDEVKIEQYGRKFTVRKNVKELIIIYQSLLFS